MIAPPVSWNGTRNSMPFTVRGGNISGVLVSTRTGGRCAAVSCPGTTAGRAVPVRRAPRTSARSEREAYLSDRRDTDDVGLQQAGRHHESGAGGRGDQRLARRRQRRRQEQ